MKKALVSEYAYSKEHHHSKYIKNTDNLKNLKVQTHFVSLR